MNLQDGRESTVLCVHTALECGHEPDSVLSAPCGELHVASSLRNPRTTAPRPGELLAQVRTSTHHSSQTGPAVHTLGLPVGLRRHWVPMPRTWGRRTWSQKGSGLPLKAPQLGRGKCVRGKTITWLNEEKEPKTRVLTNPPCAAALRPQEAANAHWQVGFRAASAGTLQRAPSEQWTSRATAGSQVPATAAGPALAGS